MKMETRRPNYQYARISRRLQISVGFSPNMSVSRIGYEFIRDEDTFSPWTLTVHYRHYATRGVVRRVQKDGYATEYDWVLFIPCFRL